MIFQESRPAPMLHNFRSRTATVDIQNVSANLLSHFRCHAHAFGLSPEDLNSKGPFVFIETHLPFRFWIVASQAFNGNEFGNGETYAAALLQQASKGDVGDASHW